MPYNEQGLWLLFWVVLAVRTFCIETWADAALTVCRCEGYITVVDVVPVRIPLLHIYCLILTVSAYAEPYVRSCCPGKLAHCQGAEAAYPCPYIRLSFANASEAQIEEGMRRLGEVLRKCQQTFLPQADSA